MATYLEIEQVTNTYNARQRAIRFSRALFDLEKGKIIPQDVTRLKFAISPEPIRYDTNNNAVWGVECKPTDVVNLSADIIKQELLGVLCQILPHVLVNKGVTYLQGLAQQIILWRDDEEINLTMQDLANLSGGVFVEKTFETDND